MEYGNLVKVPLAYNRKCNRWSKIINKDNNMYITVERINIDDYEPNITKEE